MQQPSCQVRVGVRVRPLTSGEISSGGKAVVEASPIDHTVAVAKRAFTYDAVFDSGVAQSDLYDAVSPSLLGSFLDGYNATIMAYGQTSSGKTYTMGSEAHTSGDIMNAAGTSTSSNTGLIPRFMADMFASLEEQKRIAAAKATAAAVSPIKQHHHQQKLDTGNDKGDSSSSNRMIDYRVSASFLEVYGEDVHDLLDEDRKTLPLREDASGGVIVVGLKSRAVVTASEALNVLHAGTLNRTTAATLMNHQSSRSHAVFTVYLHQTIRNDETGVDVTSSSRFTFVDLAGSERMKKTGAEGERAREGIKINEGLLALGNVINALADEGRQAKGGNVHIPYRQSKLTRLLQDALGGNSQTLFLACVSPSDGNASETLSTLHYANRAKNIKNAPTKNIDATMMEVQRLHSLTYVLQNELVKQMFRGDSAATESLAPASSSSSGSCDIGQASAELFERTEVKEYMEKIRRAAEEKQQSGSVPMKSNSFSFSVAPTGMSSAIGTTSKHNMSVVSSSTVSRGQSSQQQRPGSEDLTSHSTMAGTIHGSSEQLLDAAFLDDVDPDEDMAILDQLLEIQHHDQEFDKVHKEDQVQLEKVEGQIEEQETLLLQLKESMKVYHDMKGKYEALMGEVQSLESEKASLARELERVQVDPSKGCSVAIKRKLEKVETSLARARSETRKHQQMYRKAEQEAQKCRVLERKINGLKQDKVSLMKKQREAAAKHRTFVDTKTREIHALKKKERIAGQKLSKAKAECHKYKTNLERRKQYCEKLQDKLKQTESHLMSLLAMRKRELYKRTKSGQLAGGQTSADSRSIHTDSRAGYAGVSDNRSGEDNAYAERTEEVRSISFLLEKMVSDRVSYSQNKSSYERKVHEYSSLMRQLTTELQALKAMKKDEKPTQDHKQDAQAKLEALRDHEHAIGDLELKLDLIGAELEDLRAKLPRKDVENCLSDGATTDGSHPSEEPTSLTKSEDAAWRMISNLDAPIIRTILWDMLDLFSKSELERQSLAETLKLKESALQSFEAEVQSLNEKLSSLSGEIGERRRLSTADGGGDPLELILQKEQELVNLRANYQRCEEEKEAAKAASRCAEDELRGKQVELSETREKLTVAEVAIRRSGGAEEAEQTLAKLQEIWNEVGVSADEREVARMQIEKCLEDTCSRKCEDAAQLRKQTIVDIKGVHGTLVNIYQALGIPEMIGATDSITSEASTLIEHLEILKKRMDHIMPTYSNAFDRRSKLAAEVTALIGALHPLREDMLGDNIKTMLKGKHTGEKRRRVHMPREATPAAKSAKKRREDMFKNVEGMVKALEGGTTTADLSQHHAADNDRQSTDSLNKEEDQTLGALEAPHSLAASFLDDCEKDIKQLRLVKTEVLVANGDARSRTQLLAKEMHLTARDVVSLVVHSTKKQRKAFPEWWDPQVADNVCRIVTSKDALVRSDGLFSKHLNFVRECMECVALGRRALSHTLKGVVENAYKTLLTAVEGETYASEAYDGFTEALFRLPPLSKENIRSCIDEMETLVTAVDAMSQSEIEALTVVWDAITITATERGNFWSDLEEAIASVQSQGDGPFNEIFSACTTDLEDWVRSSAVDAKKIYRLLNIRLFKLGKIHEEVETQRSKQDNKSKIIQLDAEVRILSAKLADFEEKASSKQRLLTKKMNSTALLKEEKFRKQMQSKFAQKLEVLGKLLQEWEQKEGQGFDASLLSDDVRTLISTSDKSGAWISQRTAFMHLRTAQQKHSTKRRADGALPLGRELPGMKHVQRPTSSSRARVAASPLRKTKPSRDMKRDAPSPSQTISASDTWRSGSGGSSIAGNVAAASSVKATVRGASVSSRTDTLTSSTSAGTGAASSIKGTISSHKRHIETPEREQVKKQHLSPEEDQGEPKQGNTGKKGLRSSNHQTAPGSPSPIARGKSGSLAVNTSLPATTNPFGNVLSKTPTPKHTTKENRPF
eukprot:CAMPEP_0178486660 /NCGR_PEP_ID=MMETSP0696-20121128/8919_1 /TAXON_ID=265572 /ORGANISM="Extubocellulus spinifer, Strain CCMP396" /LENGTH=1944 /DNA_ID=CAMNT_0020114325 /DNA_START=206 /DNA_END=6040 /DNA_ORIENTATION=-